MPGTRPPRLHANYLSTDGGTLRDLADETTYSLRTSQMDGGNDMFFVDIGQYNGYSAAYSGWGWVQVVGGNPAELHYRDWCVLV